MGELYTTGGLSVTGKLVRAGGPSLMLVNSIGEPRMAVPTPCHALRD